MNVLDHFGDMRRTKSASVLPFLLFLPDTARVDAACLCKSSLQLCPFAFAAVETAGVDGCGSHWFGVAPPVTDRCCMNASWIGALRTPDFY